MNTFSMIGYDTIIINGVECKLMLLTDLWFQIQNKIIKRIRTLHTQIDTSIFIEAQNWAFMKLER